MNRELQRFRCIKPPFAHCTIGSTLLGACVGGRRLLETGVVRRGPNGVSCNFATKNQNRLRDKMQGKLSCVIRPLPTVLFCSLLNNDEMTREV